MLIKAPFKSCYHLYHFQSGFYYPVKYLIRPTIFPLEMRKSHHQSVSEYFQTAPFKMTSLLFSRLICSYFFWDGGFRCVDHRILGRLSISIAVLCFSVTFKFSYQLTRFIFPVIQFPINYDWSNIFSIVNLNIKTFRNSYSKPDKCNQCL